MMLRGMHGGLTYTSSSNAVSIARYRTNEFGKLETRRVPKAQCTTEAKAGKRARRVRTVETGHGTGRVADARFVRGKWMGHGWQLVFVEKFLCLANVYVWRNFDELSCLTCTIVLHCAGVGIAA